VWGRSKGGGCALWQVACSCGGLPLSVGLSQIRLGWIRLWYVQFHSVRLDQMSVVKMGLIGNTEGLLAVVDIFDRLISEEYVHLDVKICKEHIWQLRVFWYRLHVTVLL
jgi:hypothetical protein